MLLADVTICAVGKMLVVNESKYQATEANFPTPLNYNAARFVRDRSISW
jgi:hypothetical protein